MRGVYYSGLVAFGGELRYFGGEFRDKNQNSPPKHTKTIGSANNNAERGSRVVWSHKRSCRRVGHSAVLQVGVGLQRGSDSVDMPSEPDSGELAPECPLAHEFPTIHSATCQRFLVARDGDVALASSMLRDHLAWRAANLPLRDDAPLIGAGLPACTWVHPGHARDGSRVVSQMCCMIDMKVGSADEYVVAFAQFLFDLLDDDSDEKLTVLIDTRPLSGAPNVPVRKLLPLIQQISKTVSHQLPERFENVVVYPVPWSLSFIWRLVRPILPTKTADKIQLLVGPSDQIDSPCPVELGRIVSLEALREEDQPRHAALARYQAPV